MNKDFILINGDKFYFEPYEITYENSKPLDKAKAKKNLLLFKQIMDKIGQDFYLMHGTLLGAMREKDFISHDIDIDLCVLEEERFRSLIPQIDESGLKLCRYTSGLMYSFIKDDIYIDVYIGKKAPFPLNMYFMIYLKHLIPKRYFDHRETIMFQGTEFLVPCKREKLMSFWYGKDWRIPVKDAPSRDEYDLENKLYLVYAFFKKKVLKYLSVFN